MGPSAPNFTGAEAWLKLERLRPERWLGTRARLRQGSVEKMYGHISLVNRGALLGLRRIVVTGDVPTVIWYGNEVS